jgi:hypothetical protein
MNHRLKLARAAEHLAVLKSAMHDYSREVNHRLVRRYEPLTDEFIVQIEITKPIPLGWSLIIGDALHNLRSSLDSLAFELCGRHSGGLSAAEGRRIQFPICDLPKSFDEEIKRKKRLRHLTPRAISIAERLQPYAPTKWQGGNPLGILRELNDIDKHRTLLLAYSNLHSGTVRISRAGDTKSEYFDVPMLGGVLRDGAIVARFQLPADFPATDVRMGTSMGLAYTLDEGVPGYDKGDVHQFLDYVRIFIEREVFPALESFL